MVYVTAVLPYVVLLVLLIRNSLLDGAWLGVKFYLVPEWSKIGDAKVCLDCLQHFVIISDQQSLGQPLLQF